MKTGIAACLLLGVATLPAIGQGAAPACDRACLEGYVDKYLDAMDANKPTEQLFAKNTKFTENGVQLPLGGEGLWYGMSGKGNYKFYVPDIETQQIAFLGTARENTRGTGEGNLVAIALRLKIVNSRITEAEQIVVRPDNTASVTGGAPRPPANAAGAAPAAPVAAAPAAGGSRFPPAAEAIDKMGKPHDVYFETIPVARRASRDELIKTANYYFAGLQRNDGKGYYPFTDDCVRFENGMVTTRECKKQFETSLKGIVSRIRDRRFVAVDRERGIVFAFAFFDHYNINWTWQLGELFKIEDGKIRRIEAIFHRAPFGINSGWSTYEQGISEEPRTIR
jgi:hypothetical protein